MAPDTSSVRRALANPVALVFAGGISFWIPYALWLLMPDWFVGDRSKGSPSFIVLAPGAVWGAMYCWYRFVLPRAPRKVLPAFWMGIIGPLSSSWLAVLLYAGAFGMIVPQFVVCAGSGFVGLALSRRPWDSSWQGGPDTSPDSWKPATINARRIVVMLLLMAGLGSTFPCFVFFPFLYLARFPLFILFVVMTKGSFEFVLFGAWAILYLLIFYAVARWISLKTDDLRAKELVGLIAGFFILISVVASFPIYGEAGMHGGRGPLNLFQVIQIYG